MSITVHELYRRKRTFNESPEETREYIITPAAVHTHSADSTEANDVEQALASGAGTNPAFGGINGMIGSLVLKSVDMQEMEGKIGCWEATATWGPAKKRDKPAVNTEEISFDITPQTVKITQNPNGSSATTGYIKAGMSEEPNDYGGGIGYNGKTFDGCDYVVPSLSFTITQYIPMTTMTNSFVKGIADTVGTVNDASFRGHAAREVLFMGASGSKRNDDEYQISFKFAAQKNASGVTLGSIGGISKTGWDHLWVYYLELEDANQKYMTKAPLMAYVEQLYVSRSFPTYLGVTA